FLQRNCCEPRRRRKMGSDPTFWSPRVVTAESPAAKQLARPCAQTVWLSPDFQPPRLGAADGAPVRSARILRAEAAAGGLSLLPCFCAQDARALKLGPIE